MNAISKKGFSLLELLLYMAILSAISVILAASFTSLVKGSSIAEAKAEVNSNARFVMDTISRDVRSAVSVSTPSSGQSSQLSLNTGSDTVTISNVNGRIQRSSVSNGADFLTSDKVAASSLSFTRIENYNSVLSATTTSIEVGVTVSHADASTPYSVSLRSTIDLP